MSAETLSLAELITYIRIMRSETQAEFAEKLGLSRTSIYKWERGLAAPTGAHRRRLAALAENLPDFRESKNDDFWQKTASFDEKLEVLNKHAFAQLAHRRNRHG